MQLSTDDIILIERAKRFATLNTEKTVQSKKLMDVVVFRMAKQLYAIESRFVLNISRSIKHLRIPCVPQHITGVANVRGRIVAIVDFAALNGTKTESNSDNSTLIIAGNKDLEFGFYVDDIDGNREICENDIQGHIPDIEQINEKHWIKTITVNGIVIFDMEKILIDETITVNTN